MISGIGSSPAWESWFLLNRLKHKDKWILAVYQFIINI
jgi:hypothetical protein